MGRVKKHRLIIAAGCIAVAVAILVTVSCENNLLSYIYKNLYYQGWKVTSWSEGQHVATNFNHELGEDYRHGFPSNMAMGSNGKIHVFAYGVSGLYRDRLLYNYKEPGASSFAQSTYTVVDSSWNPAATNAVSPAIELVSDDAPYVLYADTNVLCYHTFNPVSKTFSTRQSLYTDPSNDIKETYLFFMSNLDFKFHFFYIADDNKLYHTIEDSPINPYPPEVLVNGAVNSSIVRYGGNDLALIYSDTSQQALYFRTYTDDSVQLIWSTSDANKIIGLIAAAVDSDNKIHVCFTTYNPNAPVDQSYFEIVYITDKYGSWDEQAGISGSNESGPCGFVPPSLAISKDKYGIDRLHLAYTRLEPPWRFYIAYACYYQGEWEITPDVDPTHTNTFWTYPHLQVDSQGIVHIVYSWTMTELDRSLIYLTGTPGESQ